MIGMMNSGEQSVEFYASARQSSLYEARKRSNQSRTYTPEGRVMINGEPQSPHGVDDLWQNVITKAAATRMIKDCEKQQNSGPLATIRRFSAKLGLKKTKSGVLNDNVKVADLENRNDSAYESSSGTTELPKEPHHEIVRDTKYITNIQIDVVGPFNEESVDRPDILFEEDSVLARLLEESSRMNRREQNFDKTWGDDSGKGSIDEDVIKRANSTEIIIEKM